MIAHSEEHVDALVSTTSAPTLTPAERERQERRGRALRECVRCAAGARGGWWCVAALVWEQRVRVRAAAPPAPSLKLDGVGRRRTAEQRKPPAVGVGFWWAELGWRGWAEWTAADDPTTRRARLGDALHHVLGARERTRHGREEAFFGVQIEREWRV